MRWGAWNSKNVELYEATVNRANNTCTLNPHRTKYLQALAKQHMENYTVYETAIEGKVDISEQGVQVGTVTITDHHDQDCCEHVYADWEQLKYHINDINNLKPTKLTIKGVADIGFLMVFEGASYKQPIKVFIPCYNSQNGYYGSDLSLEVKNGDASTTVDITKFVEDVIN